MEVPFNMMVIGKVSTGKSSFINSLVGAFISCVSLNRETFNPIRYLLSSDGNYKNTLKITADLINIHKQNQTERKLLTEMNDTVKQDVNKKNKLEEKITNLKETYDCKIPSVFDFDINLYDMPGISDAEDKLGLFDKAVETWIGQMDLVLYIVDANRAFLDKHDLTEYNKVVTMIDKNIKEHGTYTELAIVVNKFDDIDDDEIGELFDQISKKINCKNIFRFSSHKFFVDNLKNGLFVPEFMVREAKKILRNAQIIDKNIYDKFCKSSDCQNIDSNTYTNDNEYIFIEPQIFDNYLGMKKGDHDNIIEYICKLKSNFINKKIETWLNKIKNILDSVPKRRTLVFQSHHFTPCSFTTESIDIINKLDRILDIRKKIMNLSKFDTTGLTIQNHIRETSNYLTIGYLWFHMRNKTSSYMKKTFYDKVFDILLEDCKNTYANNSVYIMIFSDILSSFGERTKKLLEYKLFWSAKYIVDQNNNKKYTLNNFEKIDFKKVFPSLKYLIYIAELPYHKLHDLYFTDRFYDLDDVYILRIKKFLSSNSSGQMLHELFSNSVVDEDFINKLVAEHKLMKKDSDNKDNNSDSEDDENDPDDENDSDDEKNK